MLDAENDEIYAWLNKQGFKNVYAARKDKMSVSNLDALYQAIPW